MIRLLFTTLMLIFFSVNLLSQLENIEVEKGSKITYFKNPGDMHHQYDRLNDDYTRVINHIFNSNGNHFSVDILRTSDNKRYSIISESKAKDIRYMDLQYLNGKYYLYTIETTEDNNNLYYQILDEKSSFKTIGKPVILYSKERLNKVWERYNQSMYFYANLLNEYKKYETKFSKIKLSQDKSKILHYTEFASNISKSHLQPVSVFIADSDYNELWSNNLDLPNVSEGRFNIDYNVTNEGDVIFTYFTKKENAKGKIFDNPLFNVVKFSKDSKIPEAITFELDNYIPTSMKSLVVGNNLIISGIAKDKDKSKKELNVFYYKLNLENLNIDLKLEKLATKNLITDILSEDKGPNKSFLIKDLIVNSNNEPFLILEEIHAYTSSSTNIDYYLYSNIIVLKLEKNEIKTFWIKRNDTVGQAKATSADHSGINYFFYKNKLNIQFLESKSNFESNGNKALKRIDSKKIPVFDESILVNTYGFESDEINYQILYTNKKGDAIKPMKFIMKNEKEIILDFFNNIVLKFD